MTTTNAINHGRLSDLCMDLYDYGKVEHIAYITDEDEFVDIDSPSWGQLYCGLCWVFKGSSLECLTLAFDIDATSDAYVKGGTFRADIQIYRDGHCTIYDGNRGEWIPYLG